MKRTLLLTFIVLMISVAINAQKKSELISEIQILKSRVDSIQGLVSEAQNKERISTEKAKALEVQVGELQDANSTLLKNLTSFAEVSNKNSDNINKTLARLDDKEKQLKGINDAIASNDSTAVIVLTNAKKSLGEDAKIGVSNGALIISEKLETLFGDGNKSTVSDASNAWLGKVAAILTANPNMAITIEGLSMTGELDLAASQAAAVAGVLIKDFAIAPERVTALGKDGNFKEGINLKIHPKYDAFYMMVRENMKNGNKN